MPRVNIGLSEEEKREREEYIERYGHRLTVADVGRILGVKHYNTARKWLMGFRSWNINGIYKYSIDDVMAKLAASRRDA